MTRLLPGTIASSGAVSAYSIDQSLRFNFADSSYLSRTPASSGNRTTWTWSAWVKLSNIQGDLDGVTPLFSQHYAAGTSSRDYIQLYENKIWIDFNNGSSGVFRSTRLLRDPSAWYHLVFAVDTTQATNTNRVKFYVNGEEVVWSTATYPTQNYQTAMNLSSTQTRIGGQTDGIYYVSGYLAEINFVDGQQLTPASFGETNSITNAWQPKRYTGSYGTNGFFLNFSDKSNTTAATLGKDYSGNINNFTPNGFSVTSGSSNDVLLDSPTDGTTVDTGLGGQVVGNYCTLSPADTNSPVTVTNGGLQFADAGSNGWNIFKGTIGVSSGKWYWEVVPTAINVVFCVSIASQEAPTDVLPGQSGSGGYGVTLYNSGAVYRENNSNPVENLTGYSSNDNVGVALDMDNGKVWFRVNGTWVNSGNPVAGTNAQSTTLKNYSSIWMPAVGTFYPNSNGLVNFGQRPFTYTAPTGFKTLCTANLPTPTIIKPETAFETVLYSGNSNAATQITGLNFSPDLVWIKNRTISGESSSDHMIFDTIRGAQNFIKTNSTDTQATLSTGLTAFNSNGFTPGTSTRTNETGNNYTAWAWDGGSSTITNTNGSVTSYVRVNQTAGFSVVQYNTGSNSGTYTFGHGLGAVPRFIMIKGGYTTDLYNWDIYHAELSPTVRLIINSTTDVQTQAGPWDNQRPSSTVVYQNNQSNGWYGANRNNIAYCFTDVPGYSRLGKWTNNNSNNGTFVNLGFRPKMILMKNSDNVEGWFILDSKRHTFNVNPPDGKTLQPNNSNSEGSVNSSTATIDFLSNGFKIRTTNPASGEISFGTRNYVFAAFAESPFKYARAR
jgi:hypothetical protein